MPLLRPIFRFGFVLGILFGVLSAPRPGLAQTAGVVVINEIMYNPAGDGVEWIELVNRTPHPVDLTGWFFSDGVSFVFPAGTWLDGGRYLVVCADVERVKEVYDINNAIGNWAECGEGGSGGCALSNGGERIALSEPAGIVAARVTYNDRGKWPSGADGTGHSIALIDLYLDDSEPENWALSGTLGGTPGTENDTSEGALPITVNEALLLTEGDRWVELHNAGDTEIDISGYHLTDDRNDLMKAKLPEGTTIPARGSKTFTDTELSLDFTPVAAEEGDDARRFIALSNGDGTRVIDARIFEPEGDELSEARIPDGSLTFSGHANPTRGEANTVPAERDIVINEIMYHPWNNDRRGEFVELFNRSEREIDLSGWRITKGISFDFPDGTAMAAGAYLVVARDAEYIRETYGLSPDVVIGPTTEEAIDDFGRLSDDGEAIILRDANGNIVNRVRYHDGGQWPLWPDGGGPSVELIDPFQDNTFGSAWDSSDNSDKVETQTISYSGRFTTGQPELHFALAHRGITIIDDLRMFQRVIALDPIETFVDVGEEWRYFKGTQAPSDPPDAWRQPDFDDADWSTGKSPFGYNEDALIGEDGTNFDDMREEDENPGYLSVFLRKEFTVADLESVKSLVLTVRYDDGFIAYLNGTRIAVEGMRGTAEEPEDSFDSRARRSVEKQLRNLDITEHKELLKAGTNLLAIQFHNSSITSADALLIPSLANGEFVNQDSESFVSNGDFEEERLVRGTRPGGWLIQGTHRRSGLTTKEAIEGNQSLKIIGTAKGDNKVNRLELTLPTLARNANLFIEFKARWVVGSPKLLTHGHNLAGAQFDYAKSNFLGVPLDLGTPGAQNSVTKREIEANGSANIGPVVTDVQHNPVTPRADEEVTVRARVSDPDGVKAVTLNWWVEDTRGQPGAGSTTQTAMEGPDADGFYTAIVPGQTARRRVVFFITATDTGDRVGRFPLDPNARTHAPSLDPANPNPDEQSFIVYRHDNPARPGNALWHSYRMWMPQAQEAAMTRQAHLSNQRYEGTFIFNNNTAYYNARCRWSGSPWARGGVGGSYRVYMPRDKPLHESSSIKKFNMEDHQRGGSRSVLERLSHYLIRHFNGNIPVPYSFHWLVQWQMNDRINTAREHAQAPNRQFVNYWHPEDSNGDLFEVDDRFEINDGGRRQSSVDARWTYPPMRSGDAEDPENYRMFFNVRLNKGLDDYTALIEAAKILDERQTRDPEFDQIVWDHFNVEQMLSVWAIRMNTDDWDTWGTDRGKNCYVYKGHVDGLWELYAWDMELTYNDVNRFMPPAITGRYATISAGKFPEVVRMINRPAIKRIYYGLMKKMVDNQFRSDFLAPYRTRLQRLGMSNLDRLQRNGFIDQRRSRLNNILRSSTLPGVDLSITTNGGDDFVSTVPEVTIEGRAPVEMRFIAAVVDDLDPTETGVEVRFSDRNPLAWSADMNLEQGNHTIDFLGFTSGGELLGTASINVAVDTSGVVVLSVEPEQATIGELVTISGAGLEAGATVLFGDVEATDIDATDAPSKLVVRVPDGVTPGSVAVVVRVNGTESAPVEIEVALPPEPFIRGDADLSGRLNVTDGVTILNHLFRAREIGCRDAADANDDGSVNLTDGVYVLNYLFLRGDTPAAPFPEPGLDETGDDLGCETPLALEE